MQDYPYSRAHDDLSDYASNTNENLTGVRTARVLAFFVDYFFIVLWCIPLALVVGFLGLLTFGLGWMLYGILPGTIALIYIAITLGGPAQATPGMRMMNLKMKRIDGVRIDPFLAVLHAILFWVFAPVFVLLLISLVSSKKRLLHDILLGTYMVRTH